MEDERIYEYLKDDLANLDDEVKKIRLLKHRGFLIEVNLEGKIATNAFLTEFDNEDLAECLKLNVDDMVDQLFCKDSVMAHAVSWKFKDKWGRLFASNCVYGTKVKTMQLEPFVAKLVHAMSLCGMFTYYSCDGWHNFQSKVKDRAYIGFLDRNSLLWFVVLLENSQEFAGIKVDYTVEDHIISFYFDESNRFDVYKSLDLIADILYAKRELFRKQKKLVIQMLKNQRKSSLTMSELKRLIESAYKRCDFGGIQYSNYTLENITKMKAIEFIDRVTF